MTTAIAIPEAYQAQYQRFVQAQADDAAWLKALRQASFDRFAAQGFPTMRDEEWKYTSVAAIAQAGFQLPSSPKAEGLTVEQLEAATFAGAELRLVFVNGHYARELSALPPQTPGLVVMPLAQALREHQGLLEAHLGRHADGATNPFVALNGAFLRDGAFVHLPNKTVLDAPIHLVYVTTAGGTASMSHPRTLVVAGNESQATLVESYVGVGEGQAFTNAVTELVLGENASLHHVKLQREGLGTFHVGFQHAHQARDARLATISLALGGALARTDLYIRLDGPGADVVLDGLYMAGGTQHVDHLTTVDHASPHGTSNQLYKGVLQGGAHGVFNGRVVVRKDAQHTDAHQTNKNLLLSDEAVINTKPSLEIYADDVKCTHGATIGQLDRDAIFYLRSRGLSQAEATALLTYAFASEIVGRLKVEPLRAQLEAELLSRLPASGGATVAIKEDP